MSSDAPILSYRDALIYPSDLALLDSKCAWLNDAVINFQMTRLQHRPTATGSGEARGQRSRGRQPDGADGGEGGCVQPDDLFLDPSVVSFLMHQLPEDDEDFADGASNLVASWKLTRQSNSPDLREHQRKRIFIPISDQFGADRSAFVRPGGGMHWSLLLWEIGAFCGGDAHVSLGIRFQHFDSSKGCNASAARAVASKLLKVMCAPMSKKDCNIDSLEVIECRTPQQRNGYDCCGVLTLFFAEALSSSGGFGIPKEQRESLLATHFGNNGGHEKFALGLREKLGKDIRELAQDADRQVA
ncbi:hypothetical protein ACHAXT_002017 [Thalassiosira profunda]